MLSSKPSAATRESFLPAVPALSPVNRYSKIPRDKTSNKILTLNPARACYIAELLRDGLVDMHVRNLECKERTGKMAQLYQMIGSPQFKQKLAEIDRLTDQLLELDVEETTSHQNVWKKRGLLMKQLKSMTREIDTDIRSIVERSDGGDAIKPSASVATSVATNVLRPKPFARN